MTAKKKAAKPAARNPLLLTAKIDLGDGIIARFSTPNMAEKAIARDLADRSTKLYERETKDGASDESAEEAKAIEDEIVDLIGGLFLSVEVNGEEIDKGKERMEDAGHLRGVTGYRIFHAVCFRDWAKSDLAGDVGS